ncbi:MAG TPA: hypothetical protein VK694_00190 [Verrucomicrobiae bacterium]|nr:hypothetical protein [Verrucomicrobiae bacterium]
MQTVWFLRKVSLLNHGKDTKVSREKEYVNPLDLPPLYITMYKFVELVLFLFVYWLCYLFARDWMVMDFDDLWKPDGNVGAAIGKVSFIFAWAIGVTLVIGIYQVVKEVPREHDPGETFWKGLWISINAGFFEELIYRWLRFFIAMVLLRFLNAIFYGFVAWWYTEIMIPVVNWETLGALEPQLTGHPEWLFGAAVLSAATKFEEAHEYQGWFGKTNAWFIGMVLFYVMFNYGLWAAIVVHVLYDVCVFTTRAFVNSRLEDPYRRRSHSRK